MRARGTFLGACTHGNGTQAVFAVYHRHVTALSRRRAALWTLMTVLIVVLAVAFRVPILRVAGRVLVASDPLEASDIIVVSEWASSMSALEAADLVAEKVANRVAILRGPTEPAELELIRRGILGANGSQWVEELLHSLGVASVDVIPNSAAGTEDESVLLPEWSERNHFRSIVVVTTTDHSRRLRRALRRSMKGHTAKIIVRPSRYSLFDPDRWWQTRAGFRTEISELQKLLFDIVRYPLS
jgi:hypothetical protein